MILPEDPEKEALQRQLDAEDQALADVHARARVHTQTGVQGEARDRDQGQTRTTSFNTQNSNLEGYTGLALPPPPYNPGLVHRGTIPYSLSPSQTPPPSTTAVPPIFRGSYTYPRIYNQAEASSSQITLPSTSFDTSAGNTTREQFEVDDSSTGTTAAAAAGSSSVPPRRTGRRRFFAFSPSSPEGSGVGARAGIGEENKGPTTRPTEARRDKGKRREQLLRQDQPRRGIRGLWDPYTWAWDPRQGGDWDVRRWGIKRWIWGVVFVVVSPPLLPARYRYGWMDETDVSPRSRFPLDSTGPR